MKAYQKEYSLTHSRDRREYFRAYNEAHKVKKQAYFTGRNEERRIVDKALRGSIKVSLLSHYSNGSMVCAKCGFSDMKALSIDHINGGGNKHRKETGEGINFYRWLRRSNYPEGYQVLCMNCQFIKRYDQNGYRS